MDAMAAVDWPADWSAAILDRAAAMTTNDPAAEASGTVRVNVAVVVAVD